MSKKSDSAAAALLETAPTTTAKPPPPVQYPNSLQACRVLHNDTAQLLKDRDALQQFVAEREEELGDRTMECDLGDQKQVAGLTILTTQVSAGTTRLQRLREEIDAKQRLLTNLSAPAHLDTCKGASERAHYKLHALLADGKTREQAINSRSGDNIRGEVSSIRGLKPPGANIMHEMDRLLRNAEDVFEELNQLHHEIGEIEFPEASRDWLQNNDPVQRPHR